MSMPTVTYIEHDGQEHTVQAVAGQSVMEAAVKNGVPGIAADCGGACACATCQVYLDGPWFGAAGPVSNMERAMLDFAEGVEANSRLSCQIKMSDALDGLRVRMPLSQHLF
jgi:ferredoxin, 2Fe-2S